MRKLTTKLRKYASVFSTNRDVLNNADKSFYKVETDNSIITPVTDFGTLDSNSSPKWVPYTKKPGADGEDDAVFNVRAVREAFLRVHSSLFKDYRRFISEVGSTSGQGDAVVTIDKKGMVSDRPASREYLLYIFETQLFQTFIEQSFKKSNHHDIKFFDEYLLDQNQRTWMRATFRQPSSHFFSDATKYVTIIYVYIYIYI